MKRNMKSLKFAINSVILILFAASFIVAQNTATKLELNKPLERTIKGGETHTFQFDVKAEGYARTEVEQKNIDVVVSLFAPDGNLIIEIDGKGGMLWFETVSCIAEKSGTYRIVIKTYGETKQSGDFRLKLAKIEKSEINDSKRLEAEQHLSLGRKLYLQGGKSNLEATVKDYETAIKLWDSLGEDFLQAVALVNLGGVLSDFSRIEQSSARNEQAITANTRALQIFQKIGDIRGKSRALYGLGRAYYYLKQFDKAQNYFEESLFLSQEVGDQQGKYWNLFGLADTFNTTKQIEKALGYYEKALVISREIGDRRSEARILLIFGFANYNQQNYEKSNLYFEQLLNLGREIKDRSSEALALSYLGANHNQLGQYEKAKTYYEEALFIFREIKDRRYEAWCYLGLGNIHRTLGLYEKAKTYYEQFLTISREIKDREGEGSALTGLGNICRNLAQYEKAKEYYEQSLIIFRETKSVIREGNVLMVLGSVYLFFKDYEKAKDYFEQSLAIRRKIKDRSGEGEVLDNLGWFYYKLKEFEKSKEYLKQSLAIRHQLKQYYREGQVYLSLMNVWQESGNPRTAILYGKQGINIIQQVRGNLKGLDKESQKSFLAQNISSYRRLSDLLIAEGRLAEAQTVLDFLKEEEFEQLKTRRGEISDTVPYNKAETEVIKIIENLAVLEHKQNELQEEQRNLGEKFNKQSELDKVLADIEIANKAFRESLTLLSKTEKSVENQVEDLQSEKNLQRTLSALSREMNTAAVAIYTVIGTENEIDENGKVIENKTRSKFGWVILVTPEGRKAYPIDVKDLEQTVFAFRAALSNDRYNPQPLAEKLYNAIFRQTSEKQKITLEADLETYFSESESKTIMWSLDGVLRYIPMAALHDGKNYLVEKYRQTIFTKQSLLLLNEKDSTQWLALGLGVSAGNQTLNMDKLPGVEKELKDIVKIPQSSTGIFDGLIRLNGDFKKDEALRLWREGKFPVVHIASHFSFNSFDQTASFLLIGDGKLTFADIQDKDNLFGAVDLLTLSACDTAMSANGKESEGFTYLAQSLGAKSVIASLWSVSDAGTPELMIQFYKLRAANPQMSKGEAFRQAQLSLLGVNIDQNSSSASRSGVYTVNGKGSELPLFVKDKNKPFAHPHYWASFVLIGNWR